MKLNKYLYEMITDEDGALRSGVTEDEVEEWIHTWYVDIYGRAPPIWLAGDRWYDRRKRKIKEAQENEKV
tara:strand:+ start:1291 stop:1500 length:210 start_codon:yes stop_codon:yes gene_type:complete